MMEYNSPKKWNGKALKGRWWVTVKIDGVRALWSGSAWLSRANKPLYNIPPWVPGMPRDCEVFVGSFRDTIRAVRTKNLKPDTPRVKLHHLYSLDPLDPRLDYGFVTAPSEGTIGDLLSDVLGRGHEGLVLRKGAQWIKVKPAETHDVPITGWVEGEGKHAGRLGAVNTPFGEVGTGFSDEEREAMWADAQAGTLRGRMIEVSCMHFTPDGQFRHGVFLRERPDKAAA